MAFFALSLPQSDTQVDAEFSNPDSRVFESLDDALKALKFLKSSRLKTFLSKEEATKFACDEFLSTTLLPQRIDVASDKNTGEGCLYKSLTPQELKKLKDSIVAEDFETFNRLIDENPRYLMTPCDTPSVIHSGTRSNALHVSAQKGSLRMTRKILEEIQNTSLMAKMYPEDSPESRMRRQEHLLDLYLNTRKKGDCDTPLHQASKFGHIDVVKLLSDFSSCDTKCLNKDGLTPAEVACSRMGGSADLDLKRQIVETLSDHVYIPVYFGVDNTMPAYVGDPWSPSSVGNKSLIEMTTSNTDNNFSPNASKSPFSTSPCKRSPLLVASPKEVIHGTPKPASSPLSSPLAVRAFLGPVSPIDAEKIQQEWRKCSGTNKNIRLADHLKGIERQGRPIAKKYQTNLVEYWDFLDSYVDLSTPAGLALLEDHLEKKHLEHLEKEKQKLGDLENEFADLKINGGDGSFRYMKKINDSETAFDAERLKQSQRELNREDLENANTTEDYNPLASSPLSEDIIWNRVRSNQNISSSFDDSENSHFSLDLSVEVLSKSPSGSVSSFHSATSTLSASSMETAEGGDTIFMEGLQPSRTDFQVFKAVETVDVPFEKYPNLFDWLISVKNFSEKEMSGWKSVSKSTKLREKGKRLSFNE